MIISIEVLHPLTFVNIDFYMLSLIETAALSKICTWNVRKDNAFPDLLNSHSQVRDSEPEGPLVKVYSQICTYSHLY